MDFTLCRLRGESVVCARAVRPAGARIRIAFFRCSTHYRRSTELACGQTFSLPPPRRPRLDLLGQQLVRQVLSVAQAAAFAQSPSINSVVGGEGEYGCLGHGEDLSNQLPPKKIEAWAGAGAVRRFARV